MFDKFKSFILQFSICLSVLSMNSCLNITEMSVPSVVWAPEKAVLTCVKQDDTINDTFMNIRWLKLVGNQWKLVKIHSKPSEASIRAGTPSEMKAEEGEEEEPPKEETPKEEPPKETSEEPPKETPETATDAKPEEKLEDKPEAKPTNRPEKKEEKQELYKLIGMTETEDPNIEFTQTSLSSAGLYKCVVSSTKEMREMIREMRVFYKPEEGSKPELRVSRIHDNHISVKCMAPASYPMMALNFFMNYELAPHEEVHRLPAIRTKNTTYETNDELVMNVEELRFRATERSVLNGNISIVCTATLADIHHSFAQVGIDFSGPLYHHKCLTAPFIILIVVTVIIVIIVIVAIVWLFLRKKKLNSINKVAELFNKQKTITVLVDNNINDLKIE